MYTVTVKGLLALFCLRAFILLGIPLLTTIAVHGYPGTVLVAFAVSVFCLPVLDRYSPQEMRGLNDIQGMEKPFFFSFAIPMGTILWLLVYGGYIDHKAVYAVALAVICTVGLKKITTVDDNAITSTTRKTAVWGTVFIWIASTSLYLFDSINHRELLGLMSGSAIINITHLLLTKVVSKTARLVRAMAKPSHNDSFPGDDEPPKLAA